jgi:hypothetical protein
MRFLRKAEDPGATLNLNSPLGEEGLLFGFYRISYCNPFFGGRGGGQLLSYPLPPFRRGGEVAAFLSSTLLGREGIPYIYLNSLAWFKGY